jgi:RNA polymerase sigma factor (sigma-70 family)
VKFIARKALKKHPQIDNILDLDDLISYGLMGLKNALLSHDKTLRIKKTYIENNIYWSMTNEINRVSIVDKRKLIRERSSVQRAIKALIVKLKRLPRKYEISSELNITTQELYKLQNNIQPIIHLTYEEIKASDHIYLSNSRSTEDELLLKQQKQMLRKYIFNIKNKRHRVMVKLYVYREWTDARISKLLKMSRSTVSYERTNLFDEIIGSVSEENKKREV